MTNQLDSFAAKVDAWIEDNCPKRMRTPMPASEQVWASSEIKFPTADSKIWFDAMVSKGWCTPEWPEEYGGGGLSFEEAKSFASELGLLDRNIVRDPEKRKNSAREKWNDYCHGCYTDLPTKPVNLPASIHYAYKGKGFKGYKDFLNDPQII